MGNNHGAQVGDQDITFFVMVNNYDANGVNYGINYASWLLRMAQILLAMVEHLTSWLLAMSQKVGTITYNVRHGYQP